MELLRKEGPIWKSRPRVQPSGLVATIHNRKARPREEHRTLFKAVAFGKSGLVVATVDARGHLVTYNLLHNQYRHVKHAGCGGISLTFTPNREDEVVASFVDSTVRCYNTDTGSLVATMSGHKNPVHSLSFDTSGRMMLSASVDAALIWSTADWTRLRTLGCGSGITQARFLPTCDYLAASFRDNSLLVWDSVTYDVVSRLRMPEEHADATVSCFAATPNGQYVAAGTRRGSVLVWETVSQVLVRAIDLPAPAVVVSQVAFLDNQVAAVLADDGRVLFVSAAASTCRALLEVTAGDKPILGFSMDPTGRYMASMTSHGSLLIHDVECARRYRNRVREAHRRMGVSRDLAQPVLLSKTAITSPPPARFTGGPAPGDGVEETTLPLPSSPSGDGVEGEAKADPEGDAPAAPPAPVAPTFKKPLSSTLLDAVYPPPPPSSAAVGARVFHGVTAAPPVPPRPSKVKDTRRAMMDGVPVYALARLSPQDVALNETRLQNLLHEHDRYPAKYRTLIWRFLLRLPENARAYGNLVQKGVHPAYSNLHVRYPLRDKRLLRRLRRACSALAYWSPVFGELPYLPEFVFPFVKQFGSDDLCAFECIMAVLLNWCGSWAEVFPYPPLPDLGRIETLLRHHDPQLAEHLAACGVSAQVYAWTLLRTLFSEVLAKEEWMQLWDHLVTAAGDPSLLTHAVLAYLVTFRTTLLSVVPSPAPGTDADLATSALEIQSFLQHQNAIDMTHFLRTMYLMRRSTPAYMVPAESAAGSWPGATPGSHVFGPGGIAVGPGTRADGSPTTGPAYMLPVGEYPPFMRYPKFVIDFQLQERERIRAEEEGLAKRRALSAELAARNAALEAEEKAWREERELLVAAETARQKAMADLDVSHAREREHITAEERKRRLEAINRLQESSRAALEAQRARRSAELSRIDKDASRRRAELERLVAERKEEERLLQLEFDAGTKVQDLQSQRLEEEELLELRAAAAARKRADELSDRLMGEQWRVEDEERRLRQQLDLAARQRQAEEATRLGLRREMDSTHLKTALEQEVSVAEVERERRLRHLKQDGEAAAAQQAEDARKFEELMQREESLAKRHLLAEDVATRQQTAMHRDRLLDSERKQAGLEAEARTRRLRALEAAQAKREFEEDVMETRIREQRGELREEKALQEALLGMEEERRQARDAELGLLMKEQEAREAAAFRRSLRADTAGLIARERQELEATRSQMRATSDVHDQARLRAHHEQLARNIVERERQLWEDAAAERDAHDRRRAAWAGGDPTGLYAPGELPPASGGDAAWRHAASRTGRFGLSSYATGHGTGVTAGQVREETVVGMEQLASGSEYSGEVSGSGSLTLSDTGAATAGRSRGIGMGEAYIATGPAPSPASDRRPPSV